MPVKRFSWVFLIVAIIVGFGIAGAQQEQEVAQQEQEVAPQVVAVQPYPGEEVPLDVPLTILFNQAMDQTSVEAAWSVEPAIEGTFAWQEDGKTLVFTPSAGWPIDSTLEVTISDSAAAANGLALEEPYDFVVRTAGHLEVSAVIPSDEAEGVASDATITVSFNRPVVPLVSTEDLDDLPNPLTIEPAVEGKGEWLNTSIYQFTPSADLIGGATYTVTVNAGLTAVSGAVLEEDYVFNFQTLVPEILSTYPTEGQEVLLEDAISVTFSQPMDQASVESAFELKRFEPFAQDVPGTFTWTEDGQSLTFTPDEWLPIDSVLMLRIDASIAKGLGGANLRQGREFMFSTIPLPYVRETYPYNGESDVYPGNNSAALYFGTPMNPDTFEGRYSVEPDPGEIVPYADPYSLTLQFKFVSGTTYTVTLKAGAEDKYGNAIQNDYSFSFTVGEVDDYAYVPDAYDFIVTGGYREDTYLTVNVQGTPTMQFELYRVPDEAVIELFRNLYYYDEELDDLVRDFEKVREWETTLEGESAYSMVRVPLAGEEGGALPLGTYLVVGHFWQNGYENIYPVAVGVVDSNITVKRMQNEVLVWVTDMQTGQPVVEQAVEIYQGRTPVARGTTNSDGLLRLEMNTSDYLTVVARSEQKYGVWRTYSEPRPPTQDLYLYTDRPIYRPQETLFFRGAYRQRDDFSFFLPDAGTVNVVVRDANGLELFNDAVELTPFGTFSGEVALPEDMPIGYVSIEVRDQAANYIGSANAQVAEFRVPEFSVNVTAAQDNVVAGDTIRAVINGKFFSGGMVSNAPVSYEIWSDQSYFNYTGPGRYSFTDQSYDFYYYYDCWDCYSNRRYLLSGTGTTDAEGNLIIELPNVESAGYTEQVTIEATLNDESGQYISGRTFVTLHPSSVYVGVRTDVYFGEENKPFTAEVITVTPESDPVANQAVTLKLIERRWERTPIEGQFGRYTWEVVENEVESVDVVTDSEGKASHEFTPPNAGIFVVRATTMDLRERTHTSSTRLWVVGITPVWWGEPTNTLELVADKESYVPGDVAKILVPVSMEGTSYALITLERDGVMQQEVMPIEGTTLVYDLPITEDHVPGVYFSITIVHGIDEANPTPAYRTGTLLIPVEPITKELNVTITPSTTNAQPGETVTFDIQATDADGNPVEAEFGLALVDAAILTLATPNSVSPIIHYYSAVQNYTYTEVMMVALIDGRLEELEEQAQEETMLERDEISDGEAGGFDMAAEAVPAAPPMAQAMATMTPGAGQPGFEQVEVREDFQQTPLWEAHVVTDENGQAQVSVTMPDNLTVWNLTARALTTDTLVGETTLDVSSTLPLLVRPSTPRFFVVGDEVSLAMVINNNSDEVQEVRATMQGTGFELLDGVDLEQSIQIEPNSRARLEWRAKILDVSSVDLTFIAIGNDGFQDASKPPLATAEDGTIPVYRYTAPDTVGTGGVLRDEGARTEGITIPPIADVDQGTLTLQLDPSLAVTTLDALDYLQNFRHQCIEQTVSRFLPNVMTYRALKELGVEDPVLQAKLEEALNFALARLKAAQNYDGGWGWFSGMESNPLVTAYAALGLIEAQQTGYEVDQAMLDAALAFVRTDFINPNEDTPFWQLNRQAFYFYVLTRDPRYAPSMAEMDRLFNVRLEMSQYAKAFLLMAYVRMDADTSNQRESLVSDLVTAARLSATGAHWEEEERDWWNWGSDTRTTAIVLSALIDAMPDSDLLPNAVRWLMVARRGDHWESTQETAWAVMALTDWMVVTNELEGDYDYSVILNSELEGEGTVTPETVREGRELVFEVGDLLLDEMNRVTVARGEGEGALYYTAHLRLELDASEVDAIDRGVAVSREYFMTDEEGEQVRVNEAKVGDIITVRLTITIPDSIYYFVLEDPLPAGAEAMDTSLLTTTQAIDGPQITPQYDPYWWWWWWIWDHTEIRDESVNLYADYLSPGTYVYSYQMRATVPGDFQVMPAQGYAFYFPEVFGRSDGELFTVTYAEE